MQPIPRHRAAVRATHTFPGHGPFALTIHGSSDISVEDARRDARERMDALVAAGGPEQEHDSGLEYYPSRHLPEELLEDVHSEDGTLIAAITRNRYGAAVLNTDALLICDVDLPPGGCRPVAVEWRPGREAARPALAALRRRRDRQSRRRDRRDPRRGRPARRARRTGLRRARPRPRRAPDQHPRLRGAASRAGRARLSHPPRLPAAGLRRGRQAPAPCHVTPCSMGGTGRHMTWRHREEEPGPGRRSSGPAPRLSAPGSPSPRRRRSWSGPPSRPA